MRDDPVKFSAFWIFQFLWVYIVSLPIIFVNGLVEVPLCPFDARSYSGMVLAICGLIIETAADHTKFMFKQNPCNIGKWCDQGII